MLHNPHTNRLHASPDRHQHIPLTHPCTGFRVAETPASCTRPFAVLSFSLVPSKPGTFAA